MKSRLLQFVVDAALALGLGVAVLAVVGVDAAINLIQPPRPAGPTVSETTPQDSTRPRTISLAVTKPFMGVPDRFGKASPWDDVGKLLDSLGEGYRHDVLELSDLMDLQKLKKYNVVFLGCGKNEGLDPPVLSTLRAYVSDGGTLYASDWRYDAIAKAFPDMQAQTLADAGMDKSVQADVVDPGLKDVFGDKLWLSFDLPNWKTAAFQGDRVKVLLRGNYISAVTGNLKTAPLLVRFDFGRGNVIFTSYHHGKNNSEDEKKLLKQLVFSLVTAREESAIAASGGTQFTPVKSNTISFLSQGGGILGSSKAGQEVDLTHQQSAAGKLRFDVIFPNDGARLKLTAKGPSGKLHEKSGQSSFTLEVPSAEAGSWSYTVSALDVPYDNFPVTVKLSRGVK